MIYKRVSLKSLVDTKNIKFPFIEIDIHEFSEVEAKRLLEKVLVNCSSEVKEIKIIHGFNDGVRLKNMVLNDLKSKKIRNKSQDFFNQGASIIFLK